MPSDATTSQTPKIIPKQSKWRVSAQTGEKCGFDLGVLSLSQTYSTLFYFIFPECINHIEEDQIASICKNTCETTAEFRNVHRGKG